ncbi:MAG: NAD(+) diphosphatase [Actinomycetota bacterium]
MIEAPYLARASYDRAAHRRSDDQWLATAWSRARVLLVSPDATTPVVSGNGALRLDLRDHREVAGDAARRLLGVVEGVPYFAATVPGENDWATLRQVGAATDDVHAALVATAIALELWHGRHTNCPRCGTPTTETQAGWTRLCPVDASQHFPRTDPAVIMLVHDGADRCLLGRGVDWGLGRYSTLAGFVEPGESLEAAVAREVLEEVAIVVDDVRYVASQPWPFPSSIMLGFTAHADGAAAVRPDQAEVIEAGWFTRDEVRQAAEWVDRDGMPDPSAVLRGISPKLSISRYLIDGWLGGVLP